MSAAPSVESEGPPPAPLTSVGEQRWDLLVVGAGPAGSAAACRAATLGLRTLLVDRAAFPRAKVCGGCLSPLGLAAVDSLGLSCDVRNVSVALRTLSLTARGQTSHLPLRGGVAISRESLDTMLLHRAAHCGAVVLESTVATLAENDRSHAVALLRRGGEEARVRAARVVVADGLSGSFLPKDGRWAPEITPRSRIGLGARLEDGLARRTLRDGVISMHCARSGYVGMVRLGDGTIDLAAAIDPDALRVAESPADAVNALLREADADVESIEVGTVFRGTGLLTRRRRAEDGAVLVAGDAASYVEPFTGEGMSWALTSGIAAAELVACGGAAGAWARQSGAMLARRQRGCRIVSIALRSPRLVALACRTLAFWPSIAPMVQRAFAGPWGRGPDTSLLSRGAPT
jgi:flavin-dependent dehydrogenase